MLGFPAPRVARSLYKMFEVLEMMGLADEAAKIKQEAITLWKTTKIFSYDPAITSEAFDKLVPS
jgi:hypothetical protein